MPNSLKSLLEAIRDNRGLNTIRKIAAEVESELSRAPIAEGGEQLGDYQDKALAWDAVCVALDVASPGWAGRGHGTGIKSATAAIESLSRQGGEQFGDSEPLTRASEAGDCLYRVQEYMHTHHDFLVSIREYEKAAATPITDEAIAAAPAPGGGLCAC